MEIRTGNQDLTLGREALAEVLNLSPKTVSRFERSYPSRLPPAIKVGRKRVYLRETVIEWLRAHQAGAQTARPAAQQERLVEPQRRRGRPRKLPADRGMA